MLYTQPTGTAANSPFVGKNVAAGIQGSKVPAAAVEAPQREIVALITASGQSPTGSDQQQLLKGVRSGILNFYGDGGTADALVITPNPVYGAIVDGNEFVIVKGAAANATTTPTLTVNGITQPLKKSDGSALAAGDLPAGAIITVRSLGSAFRVGGVRKSDIVPTGAGAVTLAQTIITNFPSISPPRNLTAFLAHGTATFTVPANVTWIYVQVVGAGGGGAGGSGGATWAGGAGASGGYAAGWIAVTPGQVFTVVVGQGGAGAGNANGATGGQGGTSSFGSALTGTGGYGGVGGTATCAGGNPGVGAGGQVNFNGSFGGDGNSYNAQIQGGAGGASAFGGGGRTSTTANGAMNGQAPGSGGGGVWDNRFPTTAQIGGTGADGAVLIQY